MRIWPGTVPEERIRHIDGCRAVAVLGVVLYHCVTHAAWGQRLLTLPLGTTASHWLATLLSKGAHGVDLFFVVSGFCLSYPTLEIYYREGGANFYLARYLAKRLVRILPPYYAALVLCMIAYIAFRMAHAVIPTAMYPDIGVWDVIRQLLMLDRETHLANGAFWTLFIEIRWYFLFPLLLALWLYSKKSYGALLVGLIIGYHFTRARNIDLGVLPAFMLGIVAADWHIVEHPLCRYAPILTAIAFDAALLLEPFASVPGINGVEDYGFNTQANIGWHFMCFFFVVAAGAWRPLRSVLSFAPLVVVGAASYSIYLIHQPIISYVEEQMVGHLGMSGAFVVGFFTSLAAGFVFWRVVELPFCRGTVLHDRITIRLERIMGKVLRFVGIPGRFMVGCVTSAMIVPGNGPVSSP